MRTVLCFIADSDGSGQRVLLHTGSPILHRAHLAQFTMQVNHLCRACPFVQVVHVLRDDCHLMLLLQFCYHLVSLVRLNLRQLLSPPVIEVETLLRLIIECIRTCQVNPFFVSPQTIRATKGCQSAFNADTCSCQKYYMLSSHTLLYFYQLTNMIADFLVPFKQSIVHYRDIRESIIQKEYRFLSELMIICHHVFFP